MTAHRFTPAEAKHLEFIRGLQCVVCGGDNPDAAHISYADAKAGKCVTGMNTKSDPWWVAPLCRACHRSQHDTGERAWWSSKGHDPDCPARSPLRLSLELWIVADDTYSCKYSAGMQAIEDHRHRVATHQTEVTWLAPPAIDKPVKRKRGKGPQSRPFDKTLKRKLNGETVRR